MTRLEEPLLGCESYGNCRTEGRTPLVLVAVADSVCRQWISSPSRDSQSLELCWIRKSFDSDPVCWRGRCSGDSSVRGDLQLGEHKFRSRVLYTGPPVVSSIGPTT